MSLPLTLVVGHRCQLVAAKYFRKAVLDKADLRILYGGGAYQIDLSHAYFLDLPYARPDFCLGLPVQMEPLEAVETGLRELRSILKVPTAWLLWGSGPEISCALTTARLRREPVVWWDESEQGPNIHREFIRSLMGLLPGTYENLPRPMRTIVPALVQGGNSVEKGSKEGIFLALSDHPLWRLHVDETVALVKALISTGHQVNLFVPANPTLMEALPPEAAILRDGSLRSLMQRVKASQVIVTDRVDASVAAAAFGCAQVYVGVSAHGLIQGNNGAPLTDLAEFGGNLLTMNGAQSVSFELPEDAAIRWVKELSVFLGGLT